ncbi:MAG: hypothetical protein ACI8Y4_004044 [Candidatus Poriferisodalaceae bacterium]|jgi:uncharacterized protein YndB with AHSA1/START domain
MTAQKVSVERIIKASAENIFDALADPSKHPVFDGSGTVQGHKGDQTRLALGSKFGMSMKMGLPYWIRSTVREFEENKLIAWAHFGGHRWRYELESVEGGTLVRETFDWSTSHLPKAIELAGYPTKHKPNMEATLQRLAELVEDQA